MKDTTYTLVLEADDTRHEVTVSNFTDIHSAFASFSEKCGAVQPRATLYRDGVVFGSVSDGRMVGKWAKAVNLGEVD